VSDPIGVLRVAAVQAAPVFLDPAATADKAVGLVEEAARRGARLVCFGEGFLSGHPVWLHVLPVTSPLQIELASALIASAVTIPGPETSALAETARRTGTMIVLGAVERLDPHAASLALAQVVIDPEGRLSVRRKLVPAVGERVLFTPAAGDSIRAFDSPWGPISALLGGENANPLLTWTLRQLGARIHVAAWPPHFNRPGVMGETMTITGRAIAYQNSAYVIAVAGATTAELRDRVARTPTDRALLDAMATDPGSVIWAPRGSLLAGPLPGGEGILTADLDLAAGAWASLVNHHYDRPDLFRVSVDRSPGRPTLELDVADPKVGWREPSAAMPTAAPAPDPKLVAEARRLIADRYGDRLAADEAEGLLPFAVAVLESSRRLESLDPTTDDPRSTVFADDPRGGR